MRFSLNSRRVLQVAALLVCGTMFSSMSAAQAATPPGSKPMKDIRYVIVHSPGPNWMPGKSMFEQVGLQEHVEHYRKLLDAGKLVLGGPHLDAHGGGMMVPEAGVPEEELRAFAQADPSVKSGLLVATVRPWLVGLKK
jgi:uncharacterized protein YciI